MEKKSHSIQSYPIETIETIDTIEMKRQEEKRKETKRKEIKREFEKGVY